MKDDLPCFSSSNSLLFMRVKEGHCQYIKSGLSLTIEQGESHHAWTARRNLTYHLAASGDAYIPT